MFHAWRSVDSDVVNLVGWVTIGNSSGKHFEADIEVASPNVWSRTARPRL